MASEPFFVPHPCQNGPERSLQKFDRNNAPCERDYEGEQRKARKHPHPDIELFNGLVGIPSRRRRLCERGTLGSVLYASFRVKGLTLQWGHAARANGVMRIWYLRAAGRANHLVSPMTQLRQCRVA